MENLIDIPVSLYLSTAQIDTNNTNATASNLIGGWNNTRQTFYFNVKMRNLLGDLYNKYDIFVMSLVSYASVTPINTTSVPVNLQLGGLNWLNSSYDQVSQTNSYWTPLVTLTIPATANSVSLIGYDILTNTAVFRKAEDVRFDFRFMNVLTNALATTEAFPVVTLNFKIQALKQ